MKHFLVFFPFFFLWVAESTVLPAFTPPTRSATPPCVTQATANSTCCSLSDTLFTCTITEAEPADWPENWPENWPEEAVSAPLGAAKQGRVGGRIGQPGRLGIAWPVNTTCVRNVGSMTPYASYVYVGAFDAAIDGIASDQLVRRMASHELPDLFPGVSYKEMSPSTNIEAATMERRDFFLLRSPACLSVLVIAGEVTVQSAPHGTRFQARVMKKEDIKRVIGVQGNGLPGTGASVLELLAFDEKAHCVTVQSAAPVISLCSKPGTNGQEAVTAVRALNPLTGLNEIVYLTVLYFPELVDPPPEEIAWTTGTGSTMVSNYAKIFAKLEMSPVDNHLIAVCKYFLWGNSPGSYTNSKTNFVISQLL